MLVGDKVRNNYETLKMIIQLLERKGIANPEYAELLVKQLNYDPTETNPIGKGMNDSICLLVTIEHQMTLLRCAVKIRDTTNLPDDLLEFPMEYRSKIRDLLPMHVASAGSIVEVQQIFDVYDPAAVAP